MVLYMKDRDKNTKKVNDNINDFCLFHTLIEENLEGLGI